MDAPARRVRTLRLAAPREPLVRRGALLLEDALRTATLDGAGGGRLVVVRRLDVGAIHPGAPAATLSLALERRFRVVRAAAVHALEPGAARAPAVWFRDAVEAHAALAVRLATGGAAAEWFWPLAVPAFRPPLSRGDGLRAVLSSAAETQAGAGAVVALAGELVRRGCADALFAVLAPGDGPALLRVCGWAAPTLPLRAALAARAGAGPFDVPGADAAWRAVLVRWGARWGADDARTAWLAAAALARDAPALLLHARLPERAQPLVAAALALPPFAPLAPADAPSAEPAASIPAAADGERIDASARPSSTASADDERTAASRPSPRAGDETAAPETTDALRADGPAADVRTFAPAEGAAGRSAARGRGASPGDAASADPTASGGDAADARPGPPADPAAGGRRDDGGLVMEEPAATCARSPANAGVAATDRPGARPGEMRGGAAGEGTGADEARDAPPSATGDAGEGIGADEARDAPPSATDDAGEGLEDVPPRPATFDTPRATDAAGLLFLVPVLERLGIAALLRGRPELIDAGLPARVLRHIARGAGIEADDAMLALFPCPAAEPPRCAFDWPAAWEQGIARPGWRVRRGAGRSVLLDGSGRLPLALWRGADPGRVRAAAPAEAAAEGGARSDCALLVDAWAAAARRWCRRYARMGLAAVVRRPGEVIATHTHLDLLLDHRLADVRVRRAGLDLDPGWVPWLGRVVQIHYLHGGERG